MMMKPITSVSAVRVISSFRLNRSDSNFGWFVSKRDRSDPAAHAEHYGQVFKIKYGDDKNRNE